MNKCLCGCGSDVKTKWVQGHNRRGVSPTNKKGVHYSLGYAWIYMPSHPKARKCNGYVKRSRLIAESKIGRLLKPEEDVHHINGNKLDDSIENITVLTKKQHDKVTVWVCDICMHTGCTKKHTARGLCKIHYGRYRRSGHAMPLPPSRGGGKRKDAKLKQMELN